MANIKITDLTENTDPAGEDLLESVDDPGGTPASRKVTIENVLNTPIDSSPNADTTANGMITELTAGENLSFGEVVYMRASDGLMHRADANSGTGEAPAIAIALEAITATNTGKFCLQGFVRNDAWSFTAGDTLYISTAQGGIGTGPAAGSGDLVQVLGIAMTADVIYFNPSMDVITVA